MVCLYNLEFILKFRVSSSTFKVFGPILREGLSRLTLPDIHDKKDVKIVGKVEYWLFK